MIDLAPYTFLFRSNEKEASIKGGLGKDFSIVQSIEFLEDAYFLLSTSDKSIDKNQIIKKFLENYQPRVNVEFIDQANFKDEKNSISNLFIPRDYKGESSLNLIEPILIGGYSYKDCYSFYKISASEYDLLRLKFFLKCMKIYVTECASSINLIKLGEIPTDVEIEPFQEYLIQNFGQIIVSMEYIPEYKALFVAAKDPKDLHTLIRNTDGGQYGENIIRAEQIRIPDEVRPIKSNLNSRISFQAPSISENISSSPCYESEVQNSMHIGVSGNSFKKQANNYNYNRSSNASNSMPVNDRYPPSSYFDHTLAQQNINRTKVSHPSTSLLSSSRFSHAEAGPRNTMNSARTAPSLKQIACICKKSSIDDIANILHIKVKQVKEIFPFEQDVGFSEYLVLFNSADEIQSAQQYIDNAKLSVYPFLYPCPLGITVDDGARDEALRKLFQTNTLLIQFPKDSNKMDYQIIKGTLQGFGGFKYLKLDKDKDQVIITYANDYFCKKARDTIKKLNGIPVKVSPYYHKSIKYVLAVYNNSTEDAASKMIGLSKNYVDFYQDFNKNTYYTEFIVNFDSKREVDEAKQRLNNSNILVIPYMFKYHSEKTYKQDKQKAIQKLLEENTVEITFHPNAIKLPTIPALVNFIQQERHIYRIKYIQMFEKYSKVLVSFDSPDSVDNMMNVDTIKRKDVTVEPFIPSDTPYNFEDDEFF